MYIGLCGRFRKFSTYNRTIRRLLQRFDYGEILCLYRRNQHFRGKKNEYKVQLYIHMHANVLSLSHTHTYTNALTHTSTGAHTHSHVHTHIHTCIYTHKTHNTHTHTSTWNRFCEHYFNG